MQEQRLPTMKRIILYLFIILSLYDAFDIVQAEETNESSETKVSESVSASVTFQLLDDSIWCTYCRNPNPIPTVWQFVSAVKAMGVRVTSYRDGKTGKEGECDCVGLIMGAMMLMDHEKYEVHGTNYFARVQTENLHRINDASTLAMGDLVYKARTPKQQGYSLPPRYRKGGQDANGDWNDYYHVGVVISTDPLEILHCSSEANGMALDKRLGEWNYTGRLVGLDYETPNPYETVEVAVEIFAD